MLNADVAIIGGGPSGSTLGAMLKKYAPDLDVLVLERERFPREHVGESQLPLIGPILDEIGVWDKIEAAGFPIKIGATYRWGTTDELWDFEFFPAKEFTDEPRPARYKGQRKQTAFQVDRAIYDEILLQHAEGMGCVVRQETAVRQVLHDGDRVEGFVLDSGETVTAKHYVDASGNAGTLRRAMGVELEEPSALRNVAFWDYWENAEWAVEIGVGATRVQVMSLGFGRIWFIPLGPTRTSIGLVCPADYYKSCGKSSEELYTEAIAAEPRIRALVENATREGELRATKDWSYVASRMTGPNWMLVGECAGFADPILAAGLTLAHAAAREAAYTILEIERGVQDADWLRAMYGETQEHRVRQHIRFADFWYTANGRFTDLKEYTREIARDAGLELDANQAFQWLGTGGFVNDGFGLAGTAGFSLFAVRLLTERMVERGTELAVAQNNVFKLNLQRAEKTQVPWYKAGRVHAIPCYRREGKTLPMTAEYKAIVHALNFDNKANRVLESFRRAALNPALGPQPETNYWTLVEGLEAMVRDGWVQASVVKGRPLPELMVPTVTDLIHPNVDG